MILLTSLFLVSCQGGGPGSGPGETAIQNSSNATADNTTTAAPTAPVPDNSASVPSATPSADSGTVPTLAHTFTTNITLVNFSADQETKYLKAIELVKEVVAMEAFRTAVLNHTYNGAKTFVDNAGFTNEEIYQKILDAAETLQPAKNNTMDLEVELYSNIFTSTVGYTTTASKRIWVNTKYFNSYGLTSVANNLFHEWLHKLGFDHAASYSPSRDYSVPYGIGTIMETLAGTL
jgi:hypothetical protein